MKKNDKKKVLSIIKQSNLALIKKHEEEAQELFQQVCNIASDDIEILIQLSLLAVRLKEHGYAIFHLKAALKLQPDNATIHDYMAYALIESGYRAEAKKHLDIAIGLNPDLIEAITRLGIFEKQQGNIRAAVVHLEKAISLKPSNVVPYYNLIPALRDLNRYDESLQYSEKLLKLQPDAKALTTHARTFIDLGELDQAQVYLNKAIRADKTYVFAYLDLVNIKTFTDSDKQEVKEIESVLKNELSTHHRSLLHFSMGKIYNDLKEWDTAFEHYAQANILAKPAVESKVSTKILKTTKKVLFSKVFKDNSLKRNDSATPVFIVGMPRTGSTLIEQIISSHPQASGAGELNTMKNLCNELCFSNNTTAETISNIENNIHEEFLLDISRKYLDELTENRKDKKRIVDKMPDNFLILHFIHMLFPNAYIINLSRNPIDTCLSCYFQPFHTVDWSFDIEQITNQYALYINTIKQWKKKLPSLKILDISYEDLINNPEIESKKIIEFIDLPWDDRCLEFHKNKRVVKTSSLWQVRQPIYSSSKYRWINFSKHIKPLAKRLTKYLSESDIKLLNQHDVDVSKSWLSKLIP